MLNAIVRVVRGHCQSEFYWQGKSFSSKVLTLKCYDKPAKIIGYVFKRTKKHDKGNLSSLFVAVPVKPSGEANIGAELTGRVKKHDLLKVLNDFYLRPEVKMLAHESKIDDQLLHQSFLSFRRHCIDHELPPDLHVVISDILNGAGNVVDIYPYFLRHARLAFPHLDCLDDLQKISDLRTPANWYPAARALNRKVIFHAGPTNSGKTYHAMERFLTSNSGVYCGPLKLLATEIFRKSNEKGTPCDLITGEERRFGVNWSSTSELQEAIKENAEELEKTNESPHVACTVEMTSLNNIYDVGIVDEVQMVGDRDRGWAWTRAILGLQARELHLCGEAGAIPLIQDICNTTGETLEVRYYKRLTKLTVEKKALKDLSNVRPGDCIVCFNKNNIYSVSRTLEQRGNEVAVIYGSLPPGTKLVQAAKFNDPDSSCKVMVATDAIGLGLNLSIRRIVFYSLVKTVTNENGEKEQDLISVSQALQIAGRAGRYGTQWEEGFVTCFRPDDLAKLTMLLESEPDPVTQAGLHPTAEQMEMYAYHLPHSTLSSLMDIFVHLCTVDDSLYFMCNTESFKFLADMIQHVALPLRARYVFCCAPINKKNTFACAMLLKMVRQYSRSEPINWDWMSRIISWPPSMPKTIEDLVHLESVFDCMDLYLWLSYRFQDMFPDGNTTRLMQSELDDIIQNGIFQLTRLLQNSESANYDGMVSDQSPLPRVTSSYRGEGGKGKLADRLIAQGLLTPRMLKQLRAELNNKQDPLAETKEQSLKPYTRRVKRRK